MILEGERKWDFESGLCPARWSCALIYEQCTGKISHVARNGETITVHAILRNE